MLPPSYHPSLIPCNRIICERGEAEFLTLIKNTTNPKLQMEGQKIERMQQIDTS